MECFVRSFGRDPCRMRNDSIELTQLVSNRFGSGTPASYLEACMLEEHRGSRGLKLQIGPLCHLCNLIRSLHSIGAHSFGLLPGEALVYSVTLLMEAGELLPSPLTSGFPTIHPTPDPDLISSGDYALLHNGLLSMLQVSTLEASCS